MLDGHVTDDTCVGYLSLAKISFGQMRRICLEYLPRIYSYFRANANTTSLKSETQRARHSRSLEHMNHYMQIMIMELYERRPLRSIYRETSRVANLGGTGEQA